MLKVSLNFPTSIMKTCQTSFFTWTSISVCRTYALKNFRQHALSTYSHEVYICLSEILCKFLDFLEYETNWTDGTAKMVKTQDSYFIDSSGTPWGLRSSLCKFCSMVKDNWSVETAFTSCKFPKQTSSVDLSCKYACHFSSITHQKNGISNFVCSEIFYWRTDVTQTHVMRWPYVVFHIHNPFRHSVTE
jgi:hypothetical protein